MKILHTSDWHIGKKILNKEKYLEHKIFFQFLKDVIVEEKIDHLIVAGDVFDVHRPSNQSLSIYFNFLNSISKTNCKVHIISGNHDSGEFLNVPKKFLSPKNIFIYGQLNNNLNDFIYVDEENSCSFCFLPYFKSRDLNLISNNLNLLPHAHELEKEDENIFILNKIFESWFHKTKNFNHKFLIAHHLFGDFELSGSEQSLYLSGIDSISTSLLNKYFDQVLLGHIHKYQVIKKSNPQITYCGSPLAMRFNEKTNKFIRLIEVHENEINEKKIPITAPRNYISIEANCSEYKNKFLDLLNTNKKSELPPYIELIINESIIPYGFTEEARSFFEKNQCELLSIQIRNKNLINKNENQLNATEINSLDPIKLFHSFCKEKFPDQPIDEQLERNFKTVLEELEEKNDN